MKKIIIFAIITMMIASCTGNQADKTEVKDEIKTQTEANMEQTFTQPIAVYIWQNNDGTKEDTMIIRFYNEQAPGHVANFIKLAMSGFYNGNKIFRVEPGFVVQTGSPTDENSGGPGYTIDAEFNSIKHLKGTLAMARAMDPNSAGSQYYFTLAPQPGLDNKYTVFGQIIENVELLDKIKIGDFVKEIKIIEAADHYGDDYINIINSKDIHKSETQNDKSVIID